MGIPAKIRAKKSTPTAPLLVVLAAAVCAGGAVGAACRCRWRPSGLGAGRGLMQKRGSVGGKSDVRRAAIDVNSFFFLIQNAFVCVTD